MFLCVLLVLVCHVCVVHVCHVYVFRVNAELVERKIIICGILHL
jgi:hypothetical protein